MTTQSAVQPRTADEVHFEAVRLVTTGNLDLDRKLDRFGNDKIVVLHRQRYERLERLHQRSPCV
jgi:hypothetical protein